MATAGTVVTKQTIIDDFVSAVMAPEQNRARWHSGNKPTHNYVISADNSTPGVAPYPIIGYREPGPTPAPKPGQGNTANVFDGVDVTGAASVGMANPTAADFTEAITASNIVSVLRNYAYQTTRVRLVRAGVYYQYYGGGVGTFNEQVGYAHLNDTYLRTNPLSVSGPAANDIITASTLNTFYTSLRIAANTDTYGDIIDLRICHTSCHSACHSSRGRR